MKNLLFLFLLMPMLAFSQMQPCVKVDSVYSTAKLREMGNRDIRFGIKQMTEEILSEKVSICEDGIPVEVEIISIEAPTTSTSFGPFAKEKKETIVKLRIITGKDDYWGQGKANVTVQSTFLDLNDDNLPFSKTAFSGAIKKALQEAINEM
jgi:hypothetical protein